MDIKKIITLLTTCINNILSKRIVGSNQNLAYATEYMLILIGERIREVIEEIEKFVIKEPEYFKKILEDNRVEAEESSLDIEKNKHKFREALKNTPCGEILLTFSQIRSRLEHNFHKLNEDGHESFKKSYNSFHEIEKFLKEIKEISNQNINNPMQFLDNLFRIKPKNNFQTFIELNNTLSSNPKKKNKKPDVLEQKEKIKTKVGRVKMSVDALERCGSDSKNACDIYAKAMHLVVIGENSKQIIGLCLKKNKNMPVEIKELVHKSKIFQKADSMLPKLVHPSNLPNGNNIFGLEKAIKQESYQVDKLLDALDKVEISEEKHHAEGGFVDPTKKKSRKRSRSTIEDVEAKEEKEERKGQEENSPGDEEDNCPAKRFRGELNTLKNKTTPASQSDEKIKSEENDGSFNVTSTTSI